MTSSATASCQRCSSISPRARRASISAISRQARSFKASIAGSKRICEPRQPATVDRHDVEPNLGVLKVSPRRKPGLGRPAHAALLLGADHLQGLAVAVPALLLHLAEDEPATAAGEW